MDSLLAFVRRLLEEGEVRLEERPNPSAKERAEAEAFLAQAYAAYRLEIAGALLDYDAATTTAASELVWQACWFLVSHQESDLALEKHLTMPGEPLSPAQHLSADLMLRFLPQIHRRAQALAPDDPLSRRLAQILRHWPLSGVLADVQEGPLRPLDFGGHPGLMLLYAERLAVTAKPAWLPSGKPLEYVELVFQELGNERLLHLLLQTQEHGRSVQDEEDSPR
jgi:hypothetical protein